MAGYLTLFLQFFFTLYIGASLLKKLWHPSAFINIIEGYEIVPKAFVSPLAVATILAETAGLLLLLVNPAIGGLVIACLMLTYGLAIAFNLARGRSDFDCGCVWHFGTKAPPISTLRQIIWLICRNGGAAAAAVGLTVVTSLATKLVELPIQAITLCFAAAIFFNLLMVLIETLVSQSAAADAILRARQGEPYHV